MTARGSRGLAFGATFVAVLAGGCAVWGDDPKRTFSLPNDTGDPRLVHRCHGSERVPECRSSGEGELVQPGESFDFKVYFDESRTYVIADVQGKTLGCLSVHVADGTGGDPESLSDLTPCPMGTPRSSE